MQEDFKGAIKFYKKSDVLARSIKKSSSIITANFNISYMYTLSIKMDTALIYIKKCLPYCNDSVDKSQIMNVYNNIGMTYLYSKKPNLDSAEHYLLKSIEIAEKSDALIDLYYAKSTQASILELKKDYANCERISLEVLALAEKVDTVKQS